MRRIVPLLTVLCLGFAPAPVLKPDRNEIELEKMQGTWAVVRRTLNGKDMTPRNDDLTIAIVGGRMRFLVSGKATTEWSVTLDAAKDPKVFDRKQVIGKEAGTPKTGKHDPIVLRGIYRLEGDTFQFVYTFGQAGQKRPSGFEEKERPSDFKANGRGDTMYMLYILKRVKR